MLSLIGINVPLSVIYPPGTRFILLSVRPLFQYQNGVRLDDKQLGYRYSVGCPLDCERFNVRVFEKKALCANQDITEVKEPVYVELINATLKEYRLTDGKSGISVTADEIVFSDD